LGTQNDFAESGVLFILGNFNSCACAVGQVLSTGDHARPKNDLDEYMQA